LATLVERPLPHDLDAERAVLGACALNPDAFGLASTVLNVQDFYREAHRLIFATMHGLHGRGSVIDLVTLRHGLGARIEEAGGAVYLAGLVDGVPRSSNVEHYAAVVAEHARRRALIVSLRKSEALAYEGQLSTAALVDVTRGSLADIAGGGGGRRIEPVLTFLSDVRAEAVSWLWQGRLARRRYTLLAGEPGLGKSFLTVDIAARLSTGAAFPDGSRVPKGRTLMLCAEDGLSDTVAPRVAALNGDATQIAVLEAIAHPDGSQAPVSLTDHMTAIAAAVATVKPDLIVIDPITAYLGRTDSHRDTEVRAALSPLLDLIDRANCALLAVGHLSKDSQRSALHRPGGSIAFVAAARLVFGLASDPNNPERRLLAPLKSNICAPAPTLAYRLDDGRLAWEGAAVQDVTVEELFKPSNSADREERTGAQDVLAELLADTMAWPIEAQRVLEAGKAHGISDRTMRRAAQAMGIRISRIGFGGSGRWVWHAPAPKSEDIPDSLSGKASKALSVSPMAGMANLPINGPNNNKEDRDCAFTRARVNEGGDVERI
jgi:hypothetical protein